MLLSEEAREEFERRRKLIVKARKGDRKAADRLYELYRVRFYCGDDPHVPAMRSRAWG
jgi:hypothetical protein